MACACCALPGLAPLVLVLFLATSLFSWLVRLAVRKSGCRKCSCVVAVADRLPSILVVVVLGVLGLLAYDDELRSLFFSRFLTRLSRGTDLDSVRCAKFSGLEGKVLELGPGPGTNFRCWDTKIVDGPARLVHSWTGVDPNFHFRGALEAEWAARGLNATGIGFELVGACVHLRRVVEGRGGPRAAPGCHAWMPRLGATPGCRGRCVRA